MRVAELEKQVMRMSAALQDMESGTPEPTPSDISTATFTSFHATQEHPPNDLSDHQNVRLDGHPLATAGAYEKNGSEAASPRTSAHPDFIPESILSTSGMMHEQFPVCKIVTHRREDLLHAFKEMLLPSYPIIWMAPGISIQTLEVSRPFALNSMITAACIILEPESFLSMHEATVKLLAHYVFVLGYKSKDLIHALLITATWCGLPDNLSNIKLFQWTQIAGTMAVELGLLGKTSEQAEAQELAQSTGKLSELVMESVRTSLGTYLTCSRYVCTHS